MDIGFILQKREVFAGQRREEPEYRVKKSVADGKRI